MKKIMTILLFSLVSTQSFALTSKDLSCTMTLINGGPYNSKSTTLQETSKYSLIAQDISDLGGTITTSVNLAGKNLTVYISESAADGRDASKVILSAAVGLSSGNTVSFKAVSQGQNVILECQKK